MAFLRSPWEDYQYGAFGGGPGTPVPSDPGPGPVPINDGPQFPVIDPSAPPPVVPAGSGGGNGLGAAGGGFAGGRPTFRFGDVPEFTPPTFDRPTQQDAANEPGYQFRLQGGSDALERSAAARGTLRTGGTLSDILEYGQNFASQEYGNVFNRALSSYDRRYQGARDAFAPQLAEWQTNSQAEMAAGLAQYQQDWERYQFAHRRDGQQGPIPPPPTAPDYSAFGSYGGFQ